MKRNLFLLIVSALLMASGGLNVGTIGFFKDMTSWYFTTLGVLFIILGFFGMVFSLYYLTKKG